MKKITDFISKHWVLTICAFLFLVWFGFEVFYFTTTYREAQKTLQIDQEYCIDSPLTEKKQTCETMRIYNKYKYQDYIGSVPTALGHCLPKIGYHFLFVSGFLLLLGGILFGISKFFERKNIFLGVKLFKTLTKNWIIILGVLFVGIWLGKETYSYFKYETDVVRRGNFLIEECKKDDRVSDFIATVCEHNQKEVFPLKLPDAVSNFGQIIGNHFGDFTYTVFPLFLFIISLFHFHRKWKTGYFKNALMRQSYKDFLKSTLKEAYKVTFIVPIFLLILAGVCLLFSEVTLSEAIRYIEITEYFPKFFSSQFIQEGIVFLIMYAVNIWLYSVAIVNIGLVCDRFFKYYTLNVIFSYLTYKIITIFLEGYLYAFLYAFGEFYFKNSFFKRFIQLPMHMTGGFWTMESRVPSVFYFTGYGIVLVLISGFILYRQYKDVEKVTIGNE